jgi:ElaB/YqjD/DUF883 family membrane-anchored ribosome-binding protein
VTNSKSDIDELKDLQRDSTVRRAARKKPRATTRQAAGAAKTSAATPTSTVDDSASEAQSQEVEKTNQDFAEQIEIVVKELEEAANDRPVLALLAAFSLGIIVGQLFSRR